MAKDSKMRLGLSLRGLGYHLSAWRHPQVPADGALDVTYFAQSARMAEAAKIDMIFFADSIGVRARDEPAGSLGRSSQHIELEPITLLSALAAMTSRIGLLATASTTYNEPFHIARKFASLDHISGGRAAWNAVTSWSDEEAQNFSRDAHLDYDTRYERAEEFLEVVTGLWDSWSPDGILRDKESGIFFRDGAMHRLDHRGKHFAVRGPLSSIRTPQGRPIISQAGSNEAGRRIAARFADMVYTANLEIGAARAFYSDLKGRLAAHGRIASDLKIFPAISPYIGRSAAEAQEKFEELQSLIDPLVGLQQIYRQLGDMSGHPLDGPVPPPNNPEMRSDADRLYAMAQRENLTIRQLYEKVAAASSIRPLIGTPQQIADEMEEWFRNEAADGFNLCPPAAPASVADICTLLVPELQRRGLFRTEYEGRTLRENLGLSPQLSRHCD